MHRDAILHKLNENPLGSQTIPGVMVLAGPCVHNRIYYYRLDNEFFLTSKAGIIFLDPRVLWGPQGNEAEPGVRR
jgi:hypothetical protein